MKKRIFICASLLALVLSVGLFAISVFAALGQTFGVNNRIIFEGREDSLIFDLNAVITGTTKDGDPSLEYAWNYNYETSGSLSDSWELTNSLDFDEENRTIEAEASASNRIAITYTFTITNRSENKRIKAYINQVSIDEGDLMVDITGAVGSEVIVGIQETQTVSLRLIPKVRFSGAKTCNFYLQLEPID